MSFPYSRKSVSESETSIIAQEFAANLKNGMIIILNGELGAGKTFFIKKVLKQFNVTNANSPTFAIVNEYAGDKTFYHFDFYRINNESELHNIGIEDYFSEKIWDWENLCNWSFIGRDISTNVSYSKTRLFISSRYDVDYV